MTKFWNATVVLAVAFSFFFLTSAHAQENTETESKKSIEFTYTAGAELQSAYLWRGQYLGGLSFQPDLGIGFETEHTSFNFDTWWNIGSSDWKFQHETFFQPEVDITAEFNFYGATVGVTHLYYFDGSHFFCWDKLSKWQDDPDFTNNHTSTTELKVGYNFGDMLGVGAYINWYTTIAGLDFAYDEDDNIVKRNFSSYLEIGYDYEFENIGLTLGAQIGMVPWASADLYYNDKFAVACLGLRAEKVWDFDVCTLNLFAQGTINPTGINKENAYINAAGNDKKSQQLNGTIGLGVWF